ncbi:MAG: proline/glycine betaine ABC transporter ATP-binding protein, partial [Pseudomonadota bacterium]
IILNPADDYIRDFVKDINRARVIRVDSLMGPPADVAGPEISGSTRLDAATRLMQEQKVSQVKVIDDTGKQVGTISLDQIVSSMVEKVELSGNTDTGGRSRDAA